MGRPGRVGDRIHGTDNKIDERGRRAAPAQFIDLVGGAVDPVPDATRTPHGTPGI